MARTIIGIACILVATTLASFETAAQNAEYAVLVDGRINLLSGFGVGVDDSQHRRNWLSETVDALEMSYPGGLQWGAVFITVGGDAVPQPRPFQDFSLYSALKVEMRGAIGGECVMVGIKDFDDPDNGSEPKSTVRLQTVWETYTFDIAAAFSARHSTRSPLDMKKLYTVAEFVFPCDSNAQQTIYVRTIMYREQG